MSDQQRLRQPTAILCDVGDTLLEERHFDLEAGIQEVVMEPGRIIDEVAASFRQELAECHEHHGELLLVEWLGRRGCRLMKGTTSDIEDRIWREIVELVPMPDVEESLERLSRMKTVLGAISNAYFSSRVIAGEMERHRLLRHFRFVLSSGDLGVRKPAPAIFQEGIRQTGRVVEETWFIGDRFAEDIVGASSVGLHAVWMGGESPSSPSASGSVVRDWKDFMILYERI